MATTFKEKVTNAYFLSHKLKLSAMMFKNETAGDCNINPTTVTNSDTVIQYL